MAARSQSKSKAPARGPARRAAQADRRQRILAATAQLVAKRGYRGAGVELIAERAGMSNKTFYGYFRNREDCFLACLDQIAAEGGGRIEAAVDAEAEWSEQVRAGIAAFLDYVVGEPARARTFLVESMGAGTAAMERYEATLKHFAKRLRAGRRQPADGGALPDILEDSIVGGLVWMVHQRLVAGELGDVPGLRPRMVKFALAPYLGEERAMEIAAEGAATAPVAEGSRSAPLLAPPRVAHEAPEGGERPVRMRPLRSGRGSIPADIVAQDQRKRILAALVQSVAVHGYSRTTVGRITAVASVSRQTFYQHFDDKDDCFCVAYDAAVARIDALVLEAVATQASWPGQVAAALRTLLGFLAENPDLARLTFVEAAAAGESTARQRDQDSGRFVALLAFGRREFPLANDPGEGTEEALVGAVTTQITRRVIAGEATRLAELAPELIEFTLAPFLGTEAARRAAAEDPLPGP
jgi:AcrR family transcriptional regulator